MTAFNIPLKYLIFLQLYACTTAVKGQTKRKNKTVSQQYLKIYRVFLKTIVITREFLVITRTFVVIDKKFLLINRKKLLLLLESFSL